MCAACVCYKYQIGQELKPEEAQLVGLGFFVLLAFPALAASVIIIINEYSK